MYQPKQPVNAAAEVSQLHQEVERLRQAVQARDNFIVIAAHELRNPMTSLMGLTELALKVARETDPCLPRLISLLERLETGSADYVRRATRLLEVSRIEAGNFHLQPTATDLSQLVRSVAQRYEVTAAQQNCPFECAIEPGIGGMWDTMGIEQILENLLSNAFKFGAGRPVVLRLRSDPASACLEVCDRGIGISAEQQARIFERFEQMVSNYRGNGFGIGLWVTNRLVSAMEGTIAVCSRPGEGTTFTVTLPLRAQSAK